MAQSKRIAWVSAGFNNPIIRQRLHPYPDLVIDSQNKLPELERTDALREAYERGEPLPESNLPQNFYGRYKDVSIKSLPNFFAAITYLCVSEAFAAVLRQFGLEQDLRPVDLWQGNRTTRIAGTFYLLTFSAKKLAFLPEQSKPSAFSLKLNSSPSNPVWNIRGWVADGDTALSPVALEAPDLWVDPSVSGAFFLSDRLVKALRAAKMTRTLYPRKCKIIENA